MKSQPSTARPAAPFAAALRRLLHRPWRPKWSLDPEPMDWDEADVIDFFEETSTAAAPAWDELAEWQRESWRREYRDVPA